ncbi:MAG: hypothetical protein ACYC3O_10215 [Burkholderiales bacterium]
MNIRLLYLFGIFALGLMLGGCATTPPAPPVTVADIVNMSSTGVAPEQIIDRMKAADMVYRLKASQLDSLHQKGVSDKVIDYMQQTYLDAVRRDQRVEDWNRWWQGPDGYFYGGCNYGMWPYACY